MRLFYIVNARIPTEKAHGFQIMKMCEAFADLGNEVRLVILTRKNPIKDDPFVFYGARRVFTIHYLPVIDLITYWSNLPLFNYPAHFAVMLLFFRQIKKFSKERIKAGDVIYTRDFEIAWLFRNNSNLIFEVHTISKFLRKNIWTQPWKKAARIVAITNQLKKLLVEYGVDEEKIIVAHDAVDLKNFENLPSRLEARKKLGLPLDKKLIGYVGKLKTMGISKGIEILLASLSCLKCPNFLAVIVGCLESEISAVQEERVIALPLQPGLLIPTYLKAMDVLVIPSPDLPLFRFYSSPAKLFEYMASGTPIVASDLPALREILNETNSVLVKPDSPKDLAAGINLLLNDGQLAERVASQAAIDVKEYTWDKRAKRILNWVN